MLLELMEDNIKEGDFNMFEHLNAALQDEETGHGNMRQFM